MFEMATLAAFVLAVIGLFLIPGPAVVLILARGVSSGRRTGVATALGIAAGDLLHTLLATIGLSAVLMTSALAFQIVKYAGVAYLCWLGIRAILEKPRALELPHAARIGAVLAFRQAVLTELLNPKTALFFLAFLPQFIDPARGSATLQLAALGAIFVALSAGYSVLIALSAGFVGRWLSRRRALARAQGKLLGGIYLGLGLKLAFEER